MATEKHMECWPRIQLGQSTALDHRCNSKAFKRPTLIPPKKHNQNHDPSHVYGAPFPPKSWTTWPREVQAHLSFDQEPGPGSFKGRERSYRYLRFDAGRLGEPRGWVALLCETGKQPR